MPAADDISPAGSSSTPALKRPLSCPPDSRQDADSDDMPRKRANAKKSSNKSTITSAEYYERMLRIEEEKLAVMKETLEVDKWYKKEKIALLRVEKQNQQPLSNTQKEYYENSSSYIVL